MMLFSPSSASPADLHSHSHAHSSTRNYSPPPPLSPSATGYPTELSSHFATIPTNLFSSVLTANLFSPIFFQNVDTLFQIPLSPKSALKHSFFGNHKPEHSNSHHYHQQHATNQQRGQSEFGSVTFIPLVTAATKSGSLSALPASRSHTSSSSLTNFDLSSSVSSLSSTTSSTSSASSSSSSADAELLPPLLNSSENPQRSKSTPGSERHSRSNSWSSLDGLNLNSSTTPNPLTSASKSQVSSRASSNNNSGSNTPFLALPEQEYKYPLSTTQRKHLISECKQLRLALAKRNSSSTSANSSTSSTTPNSATNLSASVNSSAAPFSNLSHSSLLSLYTHKKSVIRHSCALRIQALWRGYTARRPITCSSSAPRSRLSTLLSLIQTERLASGRGNVEIDRMNVIQLTEEKKILKKILNREYLMRMRKGLSGKDDDEAAQGGKGQSNATSSSNSLNKHQQRDIVIRQRANGEKVSALKLDPAMRQAYKPIVDLYKQVSNLLKSKSTPLETASVIQFESKTEEKLPSSYKTLIEKKDRSDHNNNNKITISNTSEAKTSSSSSGIVVGKDSKDGVVYSSVAAEKRSLQLLLNEYERDFISKRGRQIMYASDIGPVAAEWARYKQLKQQLNPSSSSSSSSSTSSTSSSIHAGELTSANYVAPAATTSGSSNTHRKSGIKNTITASLPSSGSVQKSR